MMTRRKGKNKMKITRVKETEIRRVWKDANVYAIIGRVDDLLKRDIIFNDNVKGNEEKWLGIEDLGNKITEFETLEEAKEYYRNL